MKKIFVLFLVLFSVQSIVLAETRTITTSTPAYNYNYNRYPISDYAYNRLSEIEDNIFGHDFYGQNIITRIERLEDAVLNHRYPNSSVEQRINNIIYTYNRNTSANSNTGTLKKIVNGLNSALVGTPTGYTPPISDPYYNWSSNGFGQNYGNYSDYYGRNGWHRYGKNIGTGTGIQIID